MDKLTILDNSVKITQSKIIPEKFCFSPEKKPTARTGRVLLFISSIIVREQLILFVFCFQSVKNLSSFVLKNIVNFTSISFVNDCSVKSLAQ